MKEYAGRMRVAIVAYGHTDNVICLSNSLSKYIDITLIFITSGSRFTSSIFDWDISKLPFGLMIDENIVKKYIGNEVLKYIGSNIKVWLVRTTTLKTFKDWKRENVKYIREVARFLNKKQYDVIHFNGASGFQIYFHWFLRKTPKVYTIHDYLPHSGEAKLRLKITNTLLNKMYTKLGYEFIQHYQYLSDKFSEFYVVPKERVHTVYCGPFEVYRLFSNEQVKEEPRTILFFGRISLYKGIKYLIQAVPKIKKQIPDVKVIIAGKGDLGFKAENREEYEIYNNHLSNENIINLIQRATIVVLPYIDATHSAVLMTAYAFNKPVVASAVGGIPEIIEDNVTGRLVPPGNPQALADAIVNLFSNPEKRKQMKINIKKRFSQGKFSWDYIAKRTIEVYRMAIDRC